MQVKAILSKIVLIVHVVLPSIASLCELDDVPLKEHRQVHFPTSQSILTSFN